MKKRPFLVAEISANHCGSIKLAKQLIKSAKKNGADAVKLQTYTPETMTINSNNKKFIIKEGIWKGYKLWDLYKEAHTPLIGIKNYLNMQNKTKLKYLVHLLMKQQLIF